MYASNVTCQQRVYTRMFDLTGLILTAVQKSNAVRKFRDCTHTALKSAHIQAYLVMVTIFCTHSHKQLDMMSYFSPQVLHTRQVYMYNLRRVYTRFNELYITARARLAKGLICNAVQRSAVSNTYEYQRINSINSLRRGGEVHYTLLQALTCIRVTAREGGGMSETSETRRAYITSLISE